MDLGSLLAWVYTWKGLKLLLGETGQQGSRRQSQLGRACLAREENVTLLTCFIFCLNSMYIFNVWFYFSLQAFLSCITRDYSKPPLPALSLMCDVRYLKSWGAFEHFYFSWLTP